jgi:hypothetical protein
VGCVYYCCFCRLCLRVFGGLGRRRDNSQTITNISIMVKNGHDRLFVVGIDHLDSMQSAHRFVFVRYLLLFRYRDME